MIRKSWMVLALAFFINAGIQPQEIQAQQTPAQPDSTSSTGQIPTGQTQANQAQKPADQSSSSQELSEDELGPRRRNKIKDYDKWTYNIDVGANLPRGTTKTFVRGGGVLGGAGVARNFNKYFGFRLDFQFVNLPLRTSALQQAQAPGASNHVYAFTLDPIINIPITSRYTAYGLIGPSYYHRSGKLDSSTAVPGTSCNAFYTWWGSCFITSLPLNGKFLSENQNEFGFNFGGGAARKTHLWGSSNKTEVFAEFRQQHGAHANRTTDWRSVTIGVRW